MKKVIILFLILPLLLVACSKEWLVVDLDDKEEDVPQLTIDHPVVDAGDLAVLNMRRKALQMSKIEWTPMQNMPSRVGFYSKGSRYRGIPYSSVKEIDKYVGMEVSFHTFMTAIHNPRSVIYTENISEPPYHGLNCATFYGTVCSTTVCYALGIEIPYQANMLVKLPSFAKVVPQAMDAICVGDVFWKSGHCILVTDIQMDESGTNHYEILESRNLGTYLWNYSYEEMQNVWENNNYVLYRYLDLAKNIYYEPIPFVSDEGKAQKTFAYNEFISQQRGDRVTYREGELVRLDIMDLSWLSVFLYRNGEFYKELAPAESIYLSDLPPGQYSAFLHREDRDSEPTVFEVIQTNVQVVRQKGSYQVFFSSSNADPEYLVLCVQDGTRAAILTFSEEQVVTGIRNFQKSGSGLYLKVFFKGKYGRVSNDPIPL